MFWKLVRHIRLLWSVAAGHSLNLQNSINANLHSEGLPDCSHALVFAWKLHKKSGFFWTNEGFFDEKGNQISVVGSSQSPTGQK